jgi:hypothetical protein
MCVCYSVAFIVIDPLIDTMVGYQSVLGLFTVAISLLGQNLSHRVEYEDEVIIRGSWPPSTSSVYMGDHDVGTK